jgi:hypothetical protein
MTNNKTMGEIGRIKGGMTGERTKLIVEASRSLRSSLLFERLLGDWQSKVY